MTRPQNAKLNRGFDRTGIANLDRATTSLHPAVTQLLKLQNDAGMTDKLLADKAGYASGLIPQWRLKMTLPSLTTLSNFAAVFNYELRLVPKEKKP